MTRRTASGNITASALPANPTRNQRNEMKTTTQPLRRNFLLATLASTFLLPAAQAAKLVTDHIDIMDSEHYAPVCQKILDTIHATPDFFPRLDKEGYPYILYHSPFKRQEIQKIPAYVVYPLMLESRAFSVQHVSYTMTQYSDECKNYPENVKACDKVFAERMAGIFKNQYNYLWFKDGVIDHPKGFAYKTATHLLDDPAIEEYLVGAVGYGKIFGSKKSASSSFALAFITDRYMRLHPAAHLYKDAALLYKSDNGKDRIFSYGGVKNITIQGVPIDIDSRTYILSSIRSSKDEKKVDTIWIKTYDGSSHESIFFVSERTICDIRR